MKRITLLTAVGLMAVSLAPSMAAAQGFGVSSGSVGASRNAGRLSRPTVSPYVNLLRTGDPTLNYFGTVRPQLQFQSVDDTLQRGLNRLDSQWYRTQGPPVRANEPRPERYGSTGHSSKFLTDFKGRPETFVLSMRERKLSQLEQAAETGTYRPRTGHNVLFGNAGYYYQQK